MSRGRPTLAYAIKVDEAETHESPSSITGNPRPESVRLRFDRRATSTKDLKSEPVPQLISAWLQHSNEALPSLHSGLQTRCTNNRFAKDEERLSLQGVFHQAVKAIKDHSDINLDDTHTYSDLTRQDYGTPGPQDDMTTNEARYYDFHHPFLLDSGIPSSKVEDWDIEGVQSGIIARLEGLAKELTTAAKHFEELLSWTSAQEDVQVLLRGDCTTDLAVIVDKILLEVCIDTKETSGSKIFSHEIMGAYLTKQD
ncbi:MAG: hypothetical protein TREMPRED_005961 [Tremellales sp. Tagirdzhanova-0007]|nr:MAG: hypothetical protein TREMPRED_005961 [Tremellales sp. Tagirdzhanova-0007]